MAPGLPREEEPGEQAGLPPFKSADDAGPATEFQPGTRALQRPPVPKVPVLQAGRGSEEGGAGTATNHAGLHRSGVQRGRTPKNKAKTPETARRREEVN